jgi:hypothetical protein
MFPKNKISFIYRLLCLVCYIGVILVLEDTTSLIALFIFYSILALSEKSFRNIEFIIVSIIFLLICYLLNNYWLFKIMLIIEYCFYFLDTSYYVVDEEISVDEKDYIRFKNNKKKKKGSNNLLTVYLTVHLVLLFVAIVVG